VRLALDRDGDGYFDTSELDLGSDPADPASPNRILSVSKVSTNVALAWQSVSGSKYVIEWRTNFPVAGVTNNWSTLTPALSARTNITSYTDSPPAGELQRFYRVRKEP
jgi:hypothetical protein